METIQIRFTTDEAHRIVNSLLNQEDSVLYQRVESGRSNFLMATQIAEQLQKTEEEVLGSVKRQ